MISSLLQGGIGNQMFQISTAIALAKRNNDSACFNFNYCNTPLQGNPSNKYVDNVFSKICNRDNLKFDDVYFEPKFSYTEIPYKQNLLLKGYFQSYKYFQDFEDEIKSLFELPFNRIKNDFNNFTSVHVRRGDYLKLSDYHNVCNAEYYKNAMDEIGDSNFIFFSDDMEWVKKNFKGKNIFYSFYNDEVLDLTSMTLCKNNIISNSTFSWWGAYLNNNKEKKVISPINWFGINGPKDTEDLIPISWKKI
jgi:hypothetical protein